MNAGAVDGVMRPPGGLRVTFTYSYRYPSWAGMAGKSNGTVLFITCIRAIDAEYYVYYDE